MTRLCATEACQAARPHPPARATSQPPPPRPPNARLSVPVIRLTGHVDAPPGRCNARAATLPEHVRLTRAKTGRLRCDVTPDPQLAGRWRVADLVHSRAAIDAYQTGASTSDAARIGAAVPRSYRVEEVEA